MINLIRGSVFDSKCDLVIVPCNDFGGVSQLVLEDLATSNIPYFPPSIGQGQVHFTTDVGTFKNALAIGFAASIGVWGSRNVEENIRAIAQEIKLYCEKNALHLVNIPLLGTGVGNLSPEKSFDLLKSYFEEQDFVTLNVFAYSADMFARIQYQKPQEEKAPRPPRVFISYTAESAENRKWVKSLACQLRENGVDARMDIFHLKPGQDLPQWMTNELILADKVLLICDKYYAQKADTRKGGVGWETMIIQGDMLSNTQSNKYICIIREIEIDAGLPIFVKSKYSLHWAESEIPDSEFRDLLYTLFDCDNIPPLKEAPRYIKEAINVH